MTGSNLQAPDLNVPVALPPELFDKILKHISPTSEEGRQTLLACSLVVTVWTRSSQRRLFSSVLIHAGNSERWTNGVTLSGSKDHLLGYVRSLSHWCGDIIGLNWQMRGLSQECGGYFSALRNLQSLTLFNFKVEHIGEEGLRTYFSAFRETLTYLFLDMFSTPFSAFVALVDYFPNIRTLHLRLLVLEPDEGPIPTLSRPLRGKVHIGCVQVCCSEFSNLFSKLDLEYEELVVETPGHFMGTEYLRSALQLSPSTVKFLRLMDQFRPGPGPTISKFRRLQELELAVVLPGSYHEVLLSSITSTDLQRIIFPVKQMESWDVFARRMEEWVLIDEQLCGLVDRLRAMGYRHTLEAELRLVAVEGGPGGYDFAGFLSKFREKGMVTVVNAVRGDRVLHSSIHNR